MARPQKQGLDYFPFDCFTDSKIELIEAEFGLTGFAIIVKLLQKIYGEQGYYCEWNSEVALLFAHKNNVGGNVVSETIQSALRRGVFQEDLFNRFGILTSAEIQKTYLEAVGRRKQIEIRKEYLLIKVTLKNVNVCNNSINADNNSINDCNNQQSKVKESKVKESKIKEAPTQSTISLLLSDGQALLVTEAEIFHFETLYPDLNIRKEFVSMKTWLEQNPKGRRSIGKTRQFIENWLYRKAKGELSGQDNRHPKSKHTDSSAYQGTTVL